MSDDLAKWIDPANDITELAREQYASIGQHFPPYTIVVNAHPYEDIGTRCPRCNAALPLLEHGKGMLCPECDLYMKKWGNSIWIR